MFCNRCGNANIDGADFCHACGAPLPPLASSAVPVRAAPATNSNEPYAAPAGGTIPAADDEEALKAVIGPKNQDTYLRKFGHFQKSGGKFEATWHWPAFFVTFYWLLYRKMYGWAATYFLAPMVIGFASGVLAGMQGASSETTGAAVAIVELIIMFAVAPIVANWLYYRRCLVLIEDLDRAASRERQLARLDARGGTSNIVMIIIAIFSLVALIGILAAIALPAYQDYTVRAKVSQLIIEAAPIKQEIAEQFERTGTLPQSLRELPSGVMVPGYGADFKLDGSTGILEIATRFGRPGQVAGSLYMVPALDAEKHVVWSCKSDENMKKAVPTSCR